MVVDPQIENASQEFAPVVRGLVDAFHDRKPIRTWSLIVTLYGDAIVPRGGALWLGSLITLMESFGIAPGLVRTAGSRLAADDWLSRTRIGRKSYYRLSTRGRAAFSDATRRIYRQQLGAWNGRFHVAVLSASGEQDRAAVRRSFEEAGYGLLAPTVMIRPDNGTDARVADTDAIELDAVAVADSDARRMAEQAWPLARIAAGYQRFCTQFEALDAAVAAGNRFTPLESLISRILLIHEFRRIILRDPSLPASLLPDDWPGDRAREMSGRIYRALMAASEEWLDANALNEDGPLPAPVNGFFERFAGAEAAE